MFPQATLGQRHISSHHSNLQYSCMPHVRNTAINLINNSLYLQLNGPFDSQTFPTHRRSLSPPHNWSVKD